MGFPCSGDLALKSWEGGHYFRKTLLNFLAELLLSFSWQAAWVFMEKITSAIRSYPYLLIWAVDNPVARVPLYEFASPPKGQAN